MAKSSKRAAKKEPKLPSIRPVLLAAGLALYWFVEVQGLGSQPEAAPPWGYMTMLGVRVLADFVGAWFVVAGLQLAVSLLRLGLSCVRSLWTRESA